MAPQASLHRTSGSRQREGKILEDVETVEGEFDWRVSRKERLWWQKLVVENG